MAKTVSKHGSRQAAERARRKLENVHRTVGRIYRRNGSGRFSRNGRLFTFTIGRARKPTGKPQHHISAPEPRGVGESGGGGGGASGGEKAGGATLPEPTAKTIDSLEEFYDYEDYPYEEDEFDLGVDYGEAE
jgi:hypothetical protein